ncbi:helix-turn-helix transcriptional regulator [Neobacillus cucumis]|uniref:helix-turn-helix domain-containing protein n=1 Tax=Neobacillus cucumis TaxID=1740721 RepID=UPI0018DFDB4A|nr:XRE family transcriptional regulator [Neobacillus cucumis]MBI0579486.1 helix-turn-helix transcriptional regulator [Neobacillus cucumis]
MEEVYKKIKQLRLEHDLTLKDLSEKTDLSVSFLSQIERGTSSLAITSLKKIADAFGVKMAYFFEEPFNVNYAVKKSDQKPFKIQGSASTYIRLGGDFSERKIEPLIVKMQPFQKDTEFVQHPGEEFYYVLEGALILSIDGEEYFLREGESIHFPSTLPHMWENPLDKEVVLFSVVTPVLF